MDNQYLTLRQSARKSSENIRQYFEDRDIWPDTTPRELYGGPIQRPDDPVYATSGGDIDTWENLETAVVEEYDKYGQPAFESETAQRFFEYREAATS